MKKKTTIIIIMSICTLFNGYTYSQDIYSDYQYSPQNLGLSAPQVSDFIKYGNIDVNFYNGLLDMEIELDGYSDNDFELPISLKYISNGFAPSKRPSIVGNNWILSFGGVISRTVYGSPDDTRGKYNGNANSYLKDGILVTIRDNNFKEYSESVLTNFAMEKNECCNKTPYIRGDFKYDFEPDVFRFSFGKHSGSFIIGNDGLPISLSGAGYKIDISGLAVQTYSTSNAPVNSYITISTPDGYLYKFGGDITCIEYSVPNNPTSSSGLVKERPRYITSWFLKSIKAPNNREVIFNYISTLQKQKYNSFIYSFTESLIYNAYGTTYDKIQHTTTNADCMPTFPMHTSLIAKKIIMQDNIYTPIIDKIIVDNTIEIDFDIQQTSGGFYENNDYSRQLSSIIHKYNSTEVKKTFFNYLYSGKYFFLQSLSLHDQTYKFDYNLGITLPDPMSISLDHWGFWRGGYEVALTTEANIANHCLNIENNRQVNTNVCDITLLKKITYPSGGYTEVGYEYNRCNKYLKRNMTSGKLEIISLENTTPVGGARVKTVKDYDISTQKYYNSKTFIYKNAAQTMESGIIGYRRPYITTEMHTTLNSETSYDYNTITTCYFKTRRTTKDISANDYGTMDMLDEYHIAYSDVIEQIDNNGYNVYHFSSLNDVPDDEESTHDVVISFSNSISTIDRVSALEKSGLYKTNDMSKFRGKLLTKSTYSATGELRQMENYNYNIASAKDKYNISVRSVVRGCSSYRIFSTPCLLTKKEIIDNSGCTLIERYNYNKYDLLKNTTNINSNGQKYKTLNKYPTDFNVAPYTNMVSKNILSPLVEKIIYRDDRPDGIDIDINIPVVAAAGQQNTPPYPDAASMQTQLKREVWDYSFLHSKFYKPTVYKNQQKFTDELITIANYKYDNFGNVVEIANKNGLTTTIVWNSNNQYPILKLENVTNAEWQSLMSGSFGSFFEHIRGTLVSNSQPDMNAPMLVSFINSLANALPNALITIYTYKPLVGLTSITDTRGITTYFEYDEFGRLKNTKDSDLKLLQEYNYHYKNQ
ncbi:MAG: RHS repeat protein [Prevotellaceae bacterium]|jgi:YD repeat-containing protein|nr:RHS repeat protein [Prevotellaceae bacterium]